MPRCTVLNSPAPALPAALPPLTPELSSAPGCRSTSSFGPSAAAPLLAGVEVAPPLPVAGAPALPALAPPLPLSPAAPAAGWLAAVVVVGVVSASSSEQAAAVKTKTSIEVKRMMFMRDSPEERKDARR